MKRHSSVFDFRKKKLDFEKYIQEFYISEDLAYLFCQVSSTEDIFDPYSVPGYECLNANLAQRIDNNAAFVPEQYPIVLIISGGLLDSRTRKAIRMAIHDHYVLRMGLVQEKMHQSRKKAALTFLMGLLFFLLHNIFKWIGIPGPILDTTNLLFWFFWLEAATESIFRYQELHTARTELARLSSIQVFFRKRFVDAPLSKAEQEQLKQALMTQSL